MPRASALLPDESFSSSSVLSSGSCANRTLPGEAMKGFRGGGGGGDGSGGRGTRLTAATIVSAKRCSTVPSFSSNELGWPENTSSRPITLSFTRSGAASMERMPRARQLWRSTRSSVSVSPQRSSLPVRTHSPEKPEPTCKAAPTGGALEPALARQIIMPAPIPSSFLVFSPARAIAAPEARSRDWEREATKERTALMSEPRDSASLCTADAAASMSL